MKTITKFTSAAFAVVVLAIGGATANAALGDLFVSIDPTAENGAGSILRYAPDGTQSVFASGLSQPRAMAFDHFGNLFVTTTTFDEATKMYQASVLKITSDGIQSIFATFDGNLFGQGVVFDRTGNLFVAVVDETNFPTGPSTIYKFPPNGGQSVFASFPGNCISDLVFDTFGNLVAADSWFQYIYKFAPDGTKSVFADPSAFEFNEGPEGLAFDRFGNLFASTLHSTSTGTDRILKFTPNGVGTPFATDLDLPRGLKFDRSGNLFVAERGLFAPPGDVLKFTPDGNGTVFAPDLEDPLFLVFQVVPTPRARPTPPPRPTPRPH